MTTPKVDLDTVAAEMRDNGVPAETIKVVIRGLEKAAAEEKADRVTKPKLKTQYVVLIDDPEGKLNDTPLLGWVAQLEEAANPMSLIDRAKAAGRAFNDAPRKRRKATPVKTIREVFAGVPNKFWKDGIEGHKTLPKTKEPIALIPVKGELA